MPILQSATAKHNNGILQHLHHKKTGTCKLKPNFQENSSAMRFSNKKFLPL